VSDKLNKQIASAVKNVESRTLAEKAAVFLLLLSGLAMAYLTFVSDPLKAEIATARGQIQSVTGQIGSQQSSYQNMLAASTEDPNKFANDRLAVVEREQAELDRQINALAGDLVTPGDMTGILTSVLQRQSGLELISFQNLDVRPLLGDVSAAAQNAAEGGVAAQSAIPGQVFEHGLQLQFQGDAFSTLKYLRFIEEISGSFFWDSIEFAITAWPEAMINLQIHTISTNTGFIGV
jgi:MSHA biogenesis protein MshJ